LWTCAFLFGVIIPTNWPLIPSIWIILGWVLLAFFIGLCCPARYHIFSKPSIGLLLGMAWLCYHALSLEANLPATYFNQPITISGHIVSFPEYQTKQVKFEYLLEKINNRAINPIKVLLTDYHYDRASSFIVKRGEYWELVAKLKKPRGFWNPGSFDYQALLLQRGITVTGTLIHSSQVPNPIRLATPYQLFAPVYKAMNRVHAWRITLNQNMQDSVQEPAYLGLLQALVTGVRDKILPNQWDIMRSTGTNHLFSISGLHVGFIGGIIYSIVYFLWSRIGLSYWRIPSQQVAYLAAWIGAVGYSVLSGFALPIQRVMIMFTLFVFTVLRRRALSVWHGWCTALLLTLLLNPFLVLSESFWLSFGAVAIIFYGMGGRIRVLSDASWLQSWIRSWHTQLIVSIGLIPATLFFFQQVPILGFLANLIAIPWVGVNYTAY
jgi:competence protein ComEC